MASSPTVDRGRCPAGQGTACNFALLGSFPDKSGKVGPQQVWRCARCGLGVTAPAIADVSFLYDDRESQDFQPGTAGLMRFIKATAFRREAGVLLRQLPQRPRRVLDFGCGSGLFTRCLGDSLADGEVMGSDFHEDAPPELQGRAYCGQAGLAPLAGQFDVVLAMHVLEHDDDAAGLLQRIARMARPGGIVVLEVPNIDCVWTGLLGPAWDAWYLPFHRTHFSRTSLAGLIRAQGMEILAVHDVCVPTMGRTLANMLGRTNTLPFLLAGIALHPLQWAGERLTRRPSALRVIARRADV